MVIYLKGKYLDYIKMSNKEKKNKGKTADEGWGLEKSKTEGCARLCDFIPHRNSGCVT